MQTTKSNDASDSLTPTHASKALAGAQGAAHYVDESIFYTASYFYFSFVIFFRLKRNCWNVLVCITIKEFPFITAHNRPFSVLQILNAIDEDAPPLLNLFLFLCISLFSLFLLLLGRGARVVGLSHLRRRIRQLGQMAVR